MILGGESQPSREGVLRYLKESLFGFKGTIIGDSLKSGNTFEDLTSEVNSNLPEELRVNKSIRFSSKNQVFNEDEVHNISIRKITNGNGFNVRWQCSPQHDNRQFLAVQWLKTESQENLTITFRYSEDVWHSLHIDYTNSRLITTIGQKPGEIIEIPLDQITQRTFEDPIGISISKFQLVGSSEVNPLILFNLNKFFNISLNKPIVLPQKLKIK